MGEMRSAEIRMSKAGARPSIEIAVPYGTTLAETFKLQEVLSRDIISQLSPRGCTMCNSGCDIWIHEQFDDVIRVNLETFEIMR